MKTETQFIDLKKLLELTDDGRLIYEMILPDLQRESNTRYKNTLNPCYEDTKPGLSVYQSDKGDWRHHDHGESSYSGNAIDLAADYYNLDKTKDFKQILNRLVDDLQLDRREFTGQADETPFIPECREDEQGIEKAHQYFARYGVTKDVLRRYSVRAVTKYPAVQVDGSIQWHYFPRKSTTIAYETVNYTKFYTPGAPSYRKFFSIGSKDPRFIFGIDPILDDIERTGNFERGTLILTGGEKDVLTLATLGYDAITLNSETASFPDHLTDFVELYKNVVILYDIDPTGKREAAKLSQKYPFSVCTLPDELWSKGGKDISDYMELGMPIDDLKQRILDCIEADAKRDLQAALYNAELYPQKAPSRQQLETVDPNPPADNSLMLPEEVYNLLPQMLKDICGRFEDHREKDICLLSCLTVLSTCFPKIKGVYDNRVIGCNYNLFITAPASAGKGVMNWSQILGNPINQELDHRYQINFAQYQEDLRNFDPKDGSQQKPEPPKRPFFFIPANSSSSSVYECLDANQNFGLIIDSEGDTLSTNLKNEWAKFSYLIRKAYHHERASMKRRTNDEYRVVEKPHLSILLMGTRNQVNRLIDSIEDGLFSRFVFYDVDFNLTWKDKFGTQQSDWEAFFDSCGQLILRYWKMVENGNDIFCFLDDEDRETVTSYFTTTFQSFYSRFGEHIVANVRRTCLFYYRIAMILTALRYFELVVVTDKNRPAKLTISKAQARCALLITDTLMKHLEFVFTRIQLLGATDTLKPQQKQLYKELPPEFSWQEFLSLAQSLKINQSTAEKYRRDLLQAKLIVSRRHGHYQKL